VGQDAASKSHHCANTNVGRNYFWTEMTYVNKFQNGLWDNFKLSLKISRYPTFLFVLTTIVYIGLSVFGTMTEKGSEKLLLTIVVTFIVAAWLTIRTMLNAAPNEKSVTIDANSLTVHYPFLGKDKVISFSDIICIHANRTNDKGEAVIRIKSTDNKFGLNEDYQIITSLTTKEWRENAINKKLPLIINSDIEEKIKSKQTIFGSTYISGDDTYVIRKSFSKQDQKITLAEWTNYTEKERGIKFLGEEELINVTKDIQKEARHQYSLDTKFGPKTLDYFEGQLVATYEKDNRPKEIEKIVFDMELEFKNISEIK